MLAMVLPTIFTWAYFVYAERFPPAAQQATYVVVKSVQFSFPLVWVLLILRERVRITRPDSAGLALGAAFGAVAVAAGWLVFELVLRESAIFVAAAEQIVDKVRSFGIDTVWKYALLAVFYSLFHSFLEEYYWRWFVFGQLRRLVSRWLAISLSALAFMAHHVVVLGEFFVESPWLAWLFSLAVATGGVFWAWLYDRTGSLYGPWLSHLIIDAGIFLVGFELLRGSII